ncbi:MAG: UDP-galactopyranose mutase [Clostridiales bacterium]|nr:UDP-galactopyranose mutase [Clostridiales bacterium]
MDRVIIVGAGLSGSTIARLLAENGCQVTVIDKRSTVGGNVYDVKDKNGILIQPYGPHIFHTSQKEVFDFLSRFTEWFKYEHRVKANINGKLVPVPFNLTSLFETFPKDKAERIKKILLDEVGYGKKTPILSLKSHENAEVRKFADFVYKNIFEFYTKKQWGLKPEDLGEAVMNRVPVYVSEEDRYFTDEYQFQPREGFAKMVENILTHPNITLKLGKDAGKIISLSEGQIYLEGTPFDGKLIYTGCVDELFDYKYGILPYRTLKFKFKTCNRSSFQDAAVVNYTTSKPYTRISEFTKFTCQPTEKTVIVKEYSRAFKKGKNIPYYPIPVPKNYEHYDLYKKEAEGYKNLYLLGRLANYKYINMDLAVKNAMELFEKIKEDLAE